MLHEQFFDFPLQAEKKEKVENWSLQETTKTNGISSGNG